MSISRICLALLALVSLYVRGTTFGRATRAIAERPDVAAAFGVDVGRVCQITILLASAMAGVAAVSVGALYGTASAFVGLLYGLKAFTCMLVAGNRYFEGRHGRRARPRRHRGAGDRLRVVEPARRGGVLRADRRPATSGRTGCSAPTRPEGASRCQASPSSSRSLIFTLLNVTMALGLYITALSGQLSMATAAIAGVGGYLSAILTVKFGWPFLPAIVLAACGGAVVGTLLALAHPADARLHPEADDARLRRGAVGARLQLGLHRRRQQLHRASRSTRPCRTAQLAALLCALRRLALRRVAARLCRAARCATIRSPRAPWASRSRVAHRDASRSAAPWSGSAARCRRITSWSSARTISASSCR